MAAAKIDPIPVSIATSVIDLHETFLGFSAIWSFIAIKLNNTTPKGFPITSPK